MTPLVTEFRGLVALTLRRPQDGARRILALDIPRTVWWQALALAIIVSMLLTLTANMIYPAPEHPVFAAFLNHPILNTVLTGLYAVAMIAGIDRAGRLMGGKGNFDGALRLVTWWQIVLLLISVVHFLAMFLFPLVAMMLSFVYLVLAVWLLTNFTAVLHGFRSVAGAFLLVASVSIFVLFSLAFLLMFSGLVPVVR